MHLFEILFVGILQRFPATVFMLTLRVDCVGLAVKADILMAGVTSVSASAIKSISTPRLVKLALFSGVFDYLPNLQLKQVNRYIK